MAKKEKGGEYEHHVVAVKFRVVGVGNLLLSLTDLDDIQTETLVPITMAAATRFEPLRLANFQSQRVRLVGKVSVVNEYFKIQRILVYAKPVAMEYPA